MDAVAPSPSRPQPTPHEPTDAQTPNDDMSPAELDRYMGKVFAICLGVSLALVLLTSSDVGWGGTYFWLSLGLLTLVGVFWTGLLLYALSQRRKPPTAVMLAPLLVIVMLAVIKSGALWTARWSLSQPAFEHLVQMWGPPVDETTSEDAEPKTMTCPPVVGLYVISVCNTLPGGYVFVVAGQEGPMFQTGAGFAYLPNGKPADLSEYMDRPQLERLGGGWYAYTESW